MRSTAALFLGLLASAANAQSPAAAPPQDAPLLTAQQIQQTVSGHSFTWQAAASKVSARVQYEANGYAFINLSTGLNDSGKWRIDGSQLCSEWSKVPSSCSEVRAVQEVLWLKRADGTWATMTRL